MTGETDGDATTGVDREVRLPSSLLDRYRMFSLYNSPYAAHEGGRAVDLYPDRGRGPAPSPVSGEVIDVRSVEAPPKSYADDRDHLILIDVDERDPVVGGTDRVAGGGGQGRDGSVGPDRDGVGDLDLDGGGDPDRDRTDPAPDLVARVLHVDPGVSPGDRVDRFDPLGTTVRSGFFARWVADHLHVGFRDRSANLYRASGSLPLAVGPSVEPLPWDGTGTVVATGPTYAILDRPRHPAPGDRFAGIAADRSESVVDGGFPHYDGGGYLSGGSTNGAPSLLGTELGKRRPRGIDWFERTVRVDGDPVVGLSLYAGRDRAGAKLVCPDLDLATGDRVRVTID